MDDYEIVTNIGKGSSGAVYLARSSKTKKVVAIKRIVVEESRRSRCTKAVMREANILLSLDHNHIVKCYEWFLDDKNETISMVLEFCNGGTLQDKILCTKISKSIIPEVKICEWTSQITSAVDYIHQRKILHRDLKSENVFLLKNGTVKLGDFGISKDLNHTLDKASTCVGTPCYLSPELCQDIPYNYKSDIWALGCLIFELCALKPAFDASNLISLFHKIVNCNYAELPDTCSDQLKQFVASILVREPSNRPSAANLLQTPLLHSHFDENLRNDSSSLEKSVFSPSQISDHDWSKLDDLDELLKTQDETIVSDLNDSLVEDPNVLITSSNQDSVDVLKTQRPQTCPDSANLKDHFQHRKDESSSQRLSISSCDSDDPISFDDDKTKNNLSQKYFSEDLSSSDSSDSDDHFSSDLSLSQTLNSSKGLEDEIPEVIEVVDEAPRPFVKMLENDLSNVICQQKNIGFGSLPGSAWLLSKRNQTLRQRYVMKNPVKVVTTVQRQKSNSTHLSQSYDPNHLNEKSSNQVEVCDRRPFTRSSITTINSDNKKPDIGKVLAPQKYQKRNEKKTSDDICEKSMRNLPGSGWLYRKSRKAISSMQTEDYDDDFEDDYDDDFEEEVDEEIFSSNNNSSSIKVVKEDCIDKVGAVEYEKISDLIKEGLNISQVFERCKDKIDYETLETCFLIMK